MIIDEVDDLFKRKLDLKHIFNSSWTRGTTIPRQVSVNGVWITVHFDPFCPKVVGLLDRYLPRVLRTRAIEIRMVPKRPGETVEPFGYSDDFDFTTLRHKSARWSVDNAAALREAKPTVPNGLNNRAAENWKLLLAIAELAGGDWPDLARKAAEQLTRRGRQPSDGVKLLAAFKTMLSNKTAITSEDVVTELCRIRSTFGRRTTRAARLPSVRSRPCLMPMTSTLFHCIRPGVGTLVVRATNFCNSLTRLRVICLNI